MYSAKCNNFDEKCFTSTLVSWLYLYYTAWTILFLFFNSCPLLLNLLIYLNNIEIQLSSIQVFCPSQIVPSANIQKEFYWILYLHGECKIKFTLTPWFSDFIVQLPSRYIWRISIPVAIMIRQLKAHIASFPSIIWARKPYSLFRKLATEFVAEAMRSILFIVNLVIYLNWISPKNIWLFDRSWKLAVLCEQSEKQYFQIFSSQ